MSRFPSASICVAMAFFACVMAGCAPDTDDKSVAILNDPAANPLSTYNGTRVGHYGFGTTASEEQIAGWDIDIRPDGTGLPEGSGSAEEGELLYDKKCAECHGTFGEGAGRHPVLAGGQGSLQDSRPNRTVGSYWPYTSTLFDYIRRAMPFTQPQSLSDDETYAITAYVLYLNDLVEDDLVLTNDNLADIHLPNANNFVPDPRPDVVNERCMRGCRNPEDIKIITEVAAAESQIPDPDAATLATEHRKTHPGENTYQQYCGICHAVGVAGAPKLGDREDWSIRLDKGAETLLANAIEGVISEAGTMPPKGGFAQLTDQEVGDAVKYMLEALQ